jgi:crotonobetainyl-CoA:carnitine CoA-transferase CaiB-like acyl-CoA transferase
MTNLVDSSRALANLWALGGLPHSALAHAQVPGADPILPSSFAVGVAAQVPIAAAALAACELGHLRGQPRQDVSVNMTHAALECSAWFSLDGLVPNMWDAFSGLYACADGWVRVHTNFAHHRDGALRLMGLDPASATRAQAEGAMKGKSALAFEQAAADAGLVVTALRSFDEWDAHPQGQSVAALPLITWERIGDAPPLPLPAVRAHALPLTGVRALDLTRILAGPVCGRTLAAYGADVMLVNSPLLPNIASIADTSRGKRSCHIDLHSAAGRDDLNRLIAQSHVFVQGYRPGGLEALGFGPQQLATIRPGVVCMSLSAYGHTGPWQARRGFDSLTQTAMGFNQAEAEAAGTGEPKALPVQILDYATGHLMAFAAAVALARQQQEGGSWHVRLSLAQTGQWLRGLGRVLKPFDTVTPDRAPFVETSPSGFGQLAALGHSAVLSRTPARWARQSMPPGSSTPDWSLAATWSVGDSLE